MGAHVWTRDGDAGRTFSVGGQPRPQAEDTRQQQPTARPAGHHVAGQKRKLVWSRADAAPAATESSGAAAAKPTAARQPAGRPGAIGTPNRVNSVGAQARNGPAAAPPTAPGGEAPPGKRQRPGAGGECNPQQPQQRNRASNISRLSAEAADFQPSGGAAAAQNPDAGSEADVAASEDATRARAAQRQAQQAARAALAAKQVELARLRRTMAQQQRRLAADLAASAAAEAAAVQAARDEAALVELRRQRLEAGFAEAFREARAEAAEAAAAAKTAAPVADAAEVARVLAAKSDYDCLQVSAGAGRDAIRGRYRDMAKALHPDKCPEPRAKDAFQRLYQAYANLRGFVG